MYIILDFKKKTTCGLCVSLSDCGTCYQLNMGVVIGIITFDLILTLLIAISVYCFASRETRKNSVHRRKNSSEKGMCLCVWGKKKIWMWTQMNLMPLPLRQRKISPIIKQTKGGGNYGVTLSGTLSACKAPNLIPKWDKYNINCSDYPSFMLIFFNECLQMYLLSLIVPFILFYFVTGTIWSAVRYIQWSSPVSEIMLLQVKGSAT